MTSQDTDKNILLGASRAPLAKRSAAGAKRSLDRLIADVVDEIAAERLEAWVMEPICRSYAEVAAFLRKGLTAPPMIAERPPRRRIRSANWSASTGPISLDRVLAGDPACRRARHRTTNAGIPVTIVVNNCYAARSRPSEINQNAQEIIEMVERVRMVRPVDLFATHITATASAPSEFFIPFILLSRSGHCDSWDRVRGMLASSVASRGLGWLLTERTPDDLRRKLHAFAGHDYGHARVPSSPDIVCRQILGRDSVVFISPGSVSGWKAKALADLGLSLGA